MKTPPISAKFAAFSDPTRLRILHLVRDGEICVGDLVIILDLPQPTVSRHLGYLRRSGLVTTRKQGLWTAAPCSRRATWWGYLPSS